MNWFKPAIPPTWLRLHFGHELDPIEVRRFLIAILASQELGKIVFETQSTNGEVVFRIGTTNSTKVRYLLATTVPSVTITPSERQVDAAGTTWAIRANTSNRMLSTSDPEATTAALLGALAITGTGAIHQLVVGRRTQPQATPPNISVGHGEPALTQVSEALWHGHRPMPTEPRRALSDKRSISGAQVNVRLLVPTSTDTDRASPASYASAVRTTTAPGLRLRLVREDWKKARSANRSGKTLTLNVEELLTLLGWPLGETSYPGLDRARSLTLPARQSARSARILGTCTHPGTATDVGLSAKDALRHHHILGPSGVGKSTLLLNLALQDIAANRSVVVIDPKGDLVDDLLARIPPTELHRVILLDPSRTDFVVGFNPLATAKNGEQLAVDNILHVFKNLHAAAWGPRSQDILHASLLTLVGTKHASLIEIPRLLIDTRFRREVVSRADLASELRSFWKWFDQLPAGERSTVIAPLLNKLRPFTLRQSLRATLAAPEPLALKRVFSERKVLLVPLRRGQIGPEVTALFGSLLFASLWQTILSRTEVPASRRHPTIVYADEFQGYTRLPTDFADVLAQARGLGVGLVLGHQNLSQLEPSLRSTLGANAQNKTYFRLGSDDANTTARNVEALTANDFRRLPAFEAYTQLLEDDQLRPFASIRTKRPGRALRNPAVAGRELARRHGTPMAEVEQVLQAGQTDDRDLGDLDSLGRKPRGAK